MALLYSGTGGRHSRNSRASLATKQAWATRDLLSKKQPKIRLGGLSLCVSLSLFLLPHFLPLKSFGKSRPIIWVLFYFLKHSNFIFLPSITTNINYLSWIKMSLNKVAFYKKILSKMNVLNIHSFFKVVCCALLVSIITVSSYLALCIDGMLYFIGFESVCSVSPL